MRLPLFLLPLLLLLRLACGSCLAFHNRLLLPPLVHAAAAALIVSCLWLLLALPLLLPLLLLLPAALLAHCSGRPQPVAVLLQQ